MKNKHVMGCAMLFAGIMCISAYKTLAMGAEQQMVGGVSFLGTVKESSMGQSTASLVNNVADNSGFFIPDSNTSINSVIASRAALKMRITAYNSIPNQTDDTPFTTAMGTEVRDGVIAANFLPFGTRIMIPSLFGNKIFTVEDRMNIRYRHSIDIWMPDISHALDFGVRYAAIQIVGSAKQDSQELALSVQ